MTQRIINDTFWTDPYIEDLDPSEKLIFLYLLTNPLCNIAGAYEIKNKRIAYETGFDKEMIEKILKRFEKDNKIMRFEDWVIIVNFAKNQSSNPNVLKGMQRIIDGIPMRVRKALKGFERLPYFTLLNLTLLNSTLLDSTDFEKSDEFEVPILEKNNTSSNDDGLFETFWNLYKRKVSKKRTYHIFSKIKDKESVIKGLKLYCEKWEKEKTEIEFIPHPSTWLNQERRNDYIEIISKENPEEIYARKVEEMKRKAGIIT